MSDFMHQYFNRLLINQNLTPSEINSLQALCQTIQTQISTLEGNPQFYYAGSFGKKTMIRARYDLDIVVYWPHTAPYTIEGIYDAVGGVLKKHWESVNSKTVCWELPFRDGFHIDIVPGRALDAKYYEANLYCTDTKTRLKTSLKAHIDTIANSGRIPIIRLMKLWKERRQVPFKKSFLLELMTIEGCKGKKVDDYPGQIFGALTYIRDNIINCNFKDPANSNNDLSEDLSLDARRRIKAAAESAITAESCDDIFM
jgi:Second Messenger Oligonucleotide or Dinucleotide Synthetase domain